MLLSFRTPVHSYLPWKKKGMKLAGEDDTPVKPIGPGDFQPVGLGALPPIGLGSLQPISPGNCQPVGPGNL